MFSSLSRAQPFVFLDAFIGNDKIKYYQRENLFSENFENRENPFDQISDDDLVSWCEKDPGNRYTLIASAIDPFKVNAEKLEWKSIVFRIFDAAPELESIFDSIAYSMIPKSWSGSLADIIQRRAPFFKELYQHENAEIRSLAKVKYSNLRRKIIEARKSEERFFRTRFESFE